MVKVFDAKVTTASYVASLKVRILDAEKTLIYIKETGGAQSIYYKIMGRLKADDADSEKTIKTETSIAANGSAIWSITDPYEDIWIEIKDNSGHGTVDAFIVEKRES